MILLLHPKRRPAAAPRPGRWTGWLDAWRSGPRAPASSRERWIRGGILALMFVTLCLGDRGLFKLVGLMRDRAALRGEIAAMETRRTSLEADLRRFRYDRATIERVAREQLDLVQPGETVYKFPGQ